MRCLDPSHLPKLPTVAYFGVCFAQGTRRLLELPEATLIITGAECQSGICKACVRRAPRICPSCQGPAYFGVCPARGARRLLELPEATSTITGAAGEGLGEDPMIFSSPPTPLPALLLSRG